VMTVTTDPTPRKYQAADAGAGPNSGQPLSAVGPRALRPENAAPNSTPNSVIFDLAGVEGGNVTGSTPAPSPPRARTPHGGKEGEPVGPGTPTRRQPPTP